MIPEIINSETELLPVYGKLALGDPVTKSADYCTEIRVILQVFVEAVKSEYNIS